MANTNNKNIIINNKPSSILPPFFSTFLSLLGLLLLHLGCFFFTAASGGCDDNLRQHFGRLRHRHDKKFPSSSRVKRATAGAVSFVKRLFSSASAATAPHPSAPSPCSSSRSLTRPIIIPLASPDSGEVAGKPAAVVGRSHIYPCTLCGEIFVNDNMLGQHLFVKHAVSELSEGDSGHKIVQIIFKSGWPEKSGRPGPAVARILKIHNSPKILARFEEYRESVKSRAATRATRGERCVADGNELLRFYCTTFVCELRGQNGNSTLCSHQYCSVCEIIRVGFSPKMDGIPTRSTGWRAHESVPEEIEKEFGFMHVKRAVLVCRVIAGRVGSDSGLVDKEDPGFDSLLGRGEMSGVHPPRFDNNEDEELWVFNPRAVLPCFVIVYNV